MVLTCSCCCCTVNFSGAELQGGGAVEFFLYFKIKYFFLDFYIFPKIFIFLFPQNDGEELHLLLGGQFFFSFS